MVGDEADGGDRGKEDGAVGGEVDDGHGMVAGGEDTAAVELEAVELGLLSERMRRKSP